MSKHIAWLAWSFFLTPLFAVDGNYFHTRLQSWEEFTAWSTPGGGLVKDGRSMKFFIDDREQAGRVHFLNGNYRENGEVPEFVRYHYDFATYHLGLRLPGEQFNQLVYFNEKAKPFYAGLIHSYRRNGKQVLGAQLYPQDVVHDEQVARLVELLSGALQVPDTERLFVATGAQQTTATIAARAKAAGFGLARLDEVLAEALVTPLVPGRALGKVRLFPADPSRLTRQDVAVVETAPANLPVVAALVTVAPLNATSPLALRLREAGVPVVRITDAASRLRDWAGEQVELKVTENGIEIAQTTRTEPEAAKLTPAAEAGEAPIVRLKDLCEPADCLGDKVEGTYGRRAAWHGFLATAGAGLLPGVAVPGHWYRAWKKDRGAVAEELAAKLKAVLGKRGLYLLRVSAPAGDLSDFEGPGRYRAVPVKLEGSDVALARALDGLYAQVETPALNAERAARGIDAAGLAPGILVEVDDTGMAAEATLGVVTRLPAVSDVYGYLLAARRAVGAVTAVDEIEEGAAPFLRETEPTGWTPLRPHGLTLVTRPRAKALVDFVRPLEIAFCEAAEGRYYAGNCRAVPADLHKPNALLLEVVDTGRGFRVRDIRPFSGR